MKSMTTQDTLISKKRGPKPTGQGEPILVRVHPDMLKKIDAWRKKQADPPTRPEAIRRIVDLGLKRL
jgi:hypothetical protein